MVDKNKRPIGILSLDAKMIYDELVKVSIGETVSYEKLSTLIGRDVRGAAYGLMASARNRALIDDRMVFGTVAKVGLKRLNDVEIVATGEQSNIRIRRIAKRAYRRLTAVADFAAMPKEVRDRHNASVSIWGAITHMTSAKQVALVQGKVAEANTALSLQKTLEAFR